MKTKGRQGRTTQKRLEMQKMRENQRKNSPEKIEPKCYRCASYNLVEDDHSGDVICTDCGIVQLGHGLEIRVNDIPSAKRYSQDYSRKTHLNQRIKNLQIRDVKISKRIIRAIYKKCKKENIDLEHMNKKDISNMVREMKLCDKNNASKVSRSYLQIKKRLGYLDRDYCLDDIDEDVWEIIRMRFDMVSVEFDRLKKENLIDRSNIITINFLIREFLRIEDKSYLPLFSKYLTQFKENKKKVDPRKDNEPIYEMIKDRLRGREYFNEKQNKYFIFDW